MMRSYRGHVVIMSQERGTAHKGSASCWHTIEAGYLLSFICKWKIEDSFEVSSECKVMIVLVRLVGNDKVT